MKQSLREFEKIQCFRSNLLLRSSNKLRSFGLRMQPILVHKTINIITGDAFVQRDVYRVGYDV